MVDRQDRTPADAPRAPGAPQVRKGRGALSNAEGRYEALRREEVDDGWSPEGPESPGRIPTRVSEDRSRTVIARNDSPDIPFEQSINPYRGCEHGCIYCYARPTHAYLGLSPGMDFETRLFAKPDAPSLLRRELARPGYRCRLIALGTNTDPYQPVEKGRGITRGILEVLAEHDHPVSITTKSALVERDLDILAPMARRGLVQVHLSITTLDGNLARSLEPRAAAPGRRLRTVRALADAGVPVGVMVAPVIPALTDAELERIVEAAAGAGATGAGYILLRLPLEVAGLFEEWLREHVPLKADHVLSVIRQSRGGRDYDPAFGRRMRGTGVFADLLARRFAAAARRHGLDRPMPEPDPTRFRVPGRHGEQLSLF